MRPILFMLYFKGVHSGFKIKLWLFMPMTYSCSTRVTATLWMIVLLVLMEMLVEYANGLSATNYRSILIKLSALYLTDYIVDKCIII